MSITQNQAGNLDHGIEDASEHFVYVPRKCTINAQDMAFFLSTRLVTAAGGDDDANNNSGGNAEGGSGGDGDPSDAMGATGMDTLGGGDGAASSSHYYGGEEPAKRLKRYEMQVAELSSEFEDGMVRF